MEMITTYRSISFGGIPPKNIPGTKDIKIISGK